MSAIDSSQQIINMFEVTERVTELRTELFTDNGEVWPAMVNSPEQREYEMLQRLLVATRGRGGTMQWEGDRYPITLIQDAHFEDYTREYAEDLGLVADDWPSNCVDWAKAAREMRMDYASIEFDCVTYWHRN